MRMRATERAGVQQLLGVLVVGVLGFARDLVRAVDAVLGGAQNRRVVLRRPAICKSLFLSHWRLPWPSRRPLAGCWHRFRSGKDCRPALCAPARAWRADAFS